MILHGHLKGRTQATVYIRMGILAYECAHQFACVHMNLCVYASTCIKGIVVYVSAYDAQRYTDHRKIST